jgi:hypothetical protein
VETVAEVVVVVVAAAKAADADVEAMAAVEGGGLAGRKVQMPSRARGCDAMRFDAILVRRRLLIKKLKLSSSQSSSVI